MGSPLLDNGSAMASGIEELRKPMEEIRSWRLSNGTIYANKCDAAIAVLINRNGEDFRRTLKYDEQDKRYLELAEAICWFADEIRKTRKKRK